MKFQFFSYNIFILRSLRRELKKCSYNTLINYFEKKRCKQFLKNKEKAEQSWKKSGKQSRCWLFVFLPFPCRSEVICWPQMSLNFVKELFAWDGTTGVRGQDKQEKGKIVNNWRRKTWPNNFNSQNTLKSYYLQKTPGKTITLADTFRFRAREREREGGGEERVSERVRAVMFW